MAARPDENYTIRRQVFKFLGAGFDIYGSTGELIGHCHQKAFKLKEDLRIYTDKTKSEELIVITTPKVIDFSAKYDVKLPTGESIGTIQRKGLKSMLRDTWLVFNAEGKEIAKLTEDSALKAIVRRLNGYAQVLLPQSFHLKRENGSDIARFRQHFNPFIYRLGINIQDPDDEIDDLVILALGCLISAIEGRQG